MHVVRHSMLKAEVCENQHIYTCSRVHMVDNTTLCSHLSTVAHMPSASASSVVTAAEDLSTHASRTSSHLQQVARVLNQNSLSVAQRATRDLRQASTRAKAEELATDLDIILTRHSAELELFAKEHDTKMEYITKLTSHSSHYKTKRAVTIQNAKLHIKSLEVNAGTLHYIIVPIIIVDDIFQRSWSWGKGKSCRTSKSHR